MSEENDQPNLPANADGGMSVGMSFFLLIAFIVFSALVFLPTTMVPQHRTCSDGSLERAYYLTAFYPTVVTKKEDVWSVSIPSGDYICSTCPPPSFEPDVTNKGVRQALYDRMNLRYFLHAHVIVKGTDGKVSLVRPKHRELDMAMIQFFQITPWFQVD